MAKWIADNSLIVSEVARTHAESHSSISANPSFRARLECNFSDLKGVLAKLVGGPELWPHDTQFHNVRCVSAELVSLPAKYGTDSDQRLVIPTEKALIDTVYIPRPGVYVKDYLNQDVYWHDSIEPKFETMPMDHTQMVWGLTTDTVPATTDLEKLSATDAPTINNSGEILIHTIEGWALTDVPAGSYTGNLGQYLKTVNSSPYTSLQLKRTFAEKTLLLQAMSFQHTYSFRSYRLPAVPAPDAPAYDPSGKTTVTIKLTYEYKEKGWERFRRLKISGSDAMFDWYYIRYNESPYPKVVAFPPISHDIFLTYSSLM